MFCSGLFSRADECLHRIARANRTWQLLAPIKRQFCTFLRLTNASPTQLYLVSHDLFHESRVGDDDVHIAEEREPVDVSVVPCPPRHHVPGGPAGELKRLSEDRPTPPTPSKQVKKKVGNQVKKQVCKQRKQAISEQAGRQAGTQANK